MRHTTYFFAAVIGMIVISLTSVADAQQPSPVGGLTPLQIQRFSNDLVPSSAHDFFKTGQAKLEQEIQNLRQSRSRANEPLLKINQNIKSQLDNSSEHVAHTGNHRVKDSISE